MYTKDTEENSCHATTMQHRLKNYYELTGSQPVTTQKRMEERANRKKNIVRNPWK
jgi:hypothetical protein